MTGSRLTVAMAPPCSGRMKLDSSVSTALTSHSASTAVQKARIFIKSLQESSTPPHPFLSSPQASTDGTT